MDYLARDTATLEQNHWDIIDEAVNETLVKNLKGRLFLPIKEIGVGVQYINIDSINIEETYKDGVATFSGREVVELTQIYSDFVLSWRNFAQAASTSTLINTAQAKVAAQKIALQEDEVIFYGNKTANRLGLVNAKNINEIEIKDWSIGENAFEDIVEGINILEANQRYGNHTLIVSLDLYAYLQHLQLSAGVLESVRIEALLDEKIIKSPVLKSKTAVLVAAESEFIDLIIGQDLKTSYLELKDLNHHFRILETMMLRIKAPDAIVVYK